MYVSNLNWRQFSTCHNIHLYFISIAFAQDRPRGSGCAARGGKEIYMTGDGGGGEGEPEVKNNVRKNLGIQGPLFLLRQEFSGETRFPHL